MTSADGEMTRGARASAPPGAVRPVAASRTPSDLPVIRLPPASAVQVPDAPTTASRRVGQDTCWISWPRSSGVPGRPKNSAFAPNTTHHPRPDAPAVTIAKPTKATYTRGRALNHPHWGQRLSRFPQWISERRQMADTLLTGGRGRHCAGTISKLLTARSATLTGREYQEAENRGNGKGRCYARPIRLPAWLGYLSWSSR
jgi:hypothetical protein